MSTLITALLPYVLSYNYIAIFIITVLAALLLPIPPGTLLMASSALAAQGYLSFFWVIVSGILGNIVGDNIGYWLARKYGLKILYKIGFKKILESEKYKRLEDKIKKKSGFLIFITRFEAFSNLAINILAGLSRVPYKKYLLYEISGEILQVLIYCSIGYFVGNDWQAISIILSKATKILLFIAILFIIIFWKKIKKRLTRK